MSAFADEPSGSAQEETADNAATVDNTGTAADADTVSNNNAATADNTTGSANGNTGAVDSDTSANEARNDLLLPTVIAIVGFVVLCIALILLIIVWRRGRRDRDK
jgi:cobalamin biosynthesis Mg chelatase CobN